MAQAEDFKDQDDALWHGHKALGATHWSFAPQGNFHIYVPNDKGYARHEIYPRRGLWHFAKGGVKQIERLPLHSFSFDKRVLSPVDGGPRTHASESPQGEKPLRPQGEKIAQVVVNHQSRYGGETTQSIADVELDWGPLSEKEGPIVKIVGGSAWYWKQFASSTQALAIDWPHVYITGEERTRIIEIVKGVVDVPPVATRAREVGEPLQATPKPQVGGPFPVSRPEARAILKKLGGRGVDFEEFHKGINTEIGEHADVVGGDKEKAGQIALAHLKEDGRYYAKLERAGLEADEVPVLEPVAAGDAVPWVKITRDPALYEEGMKRAREIGPVKGARQVYDLLSPALAKEDQEVFLVVLLDVRMQCMGAVEVHRGERDRVTVSLKSVMRPVTKAEADSFIVVHNHPTGDPTPSDADTKLTEAIMRSAAKMDAPCIDHVVIGQGRYYSFADAKEHRVK